MFRGLTGAAVSAGAIGDVITNPFWVVRTRIQTLIFHQKRPVTGAGHTTYEAVSMFDMFKRIYANEGFAAFYKGENEDHCHCHVVHYNPNTDRDASIVVDPILSRRFICLLSRTEPRGCAVPSVRRTENTLQRSQGGAR